MTDESNPDWTKDLHEDPSAEAQAELIELRTRSAETTPEEAAQVAGLASASREWQSELAARLARTAYRSEEQATGIRLVSTRAKSKRARRIYLWASVGLAASLIAAVALIGWQRMANTPERLLAEAYTHSRIFDLRMPGAGFAGVTPQTHLRGSGTGRESAQLLDARSRIERHLESAPDDPHWLQLEARADVMEEKFDPAIDILDRLLATGPVTSSLLVDDGTAYFQRGAATGSENDRATALDYLRRADELAPGETLVLFNEAVVMEDRGQLMNAVETWNRYLQFERDPRWLAEGRGRLQALEEKLKKMKTHQSRMEQHLATPQAMRALTANPAALATIDEELSSALLPRLLDAAFAMPVDRSRVSPVNCDYRCQSARTLLHALAASLEQSHRDPWLTELLPSDSSSNNIDFFAAAHALSQAIGADVEGDYIAGRAHALQASRLFHVLRNPAGEDRALLRKHPPRAAWLTVFSACSTGKKEEGWNHGMGDIVATLASLGVPDVVATRWEIDSASAVPMMEGFYAGLAKGLTVPGALTAARQALIRDPRYRHPYYWAAWYASGLGRSNLRRVFHGGQ